MADTELGMSTAMSRLPVWAQVVSVLGIPGAILAWMFWSQNPKLEVIAAQQVKLQIDMEQQKDQTWVLYSVLNRICLNTSKTDDDRKACVSITQRPR